MDVIYRHAGIFLRDAFDSFAMCQKVKDELNSQASPAYDGLSSHNFWVQRNPI